MKNVSNEQIERSSGHIIVYHNASNLKYNCVIPTQGWRFKPLEKGEVVMIFEIPKEATGKMVWYPTSNPHNIYFVNEKQKP